MKLTHTQNVKTKSGMTLLELTVVILVLLSLISILFIGARAWKKGSDRAASILQIRNVQQAVRSYSNMNGKNAGETVSDLKGEIFGTGKFIENDPTGTLAAGEDPASGARHPAGPKYVFTIAEANVIPEVGDLYMETTGADDADDYNPAEGTYNDW